MVSNYLSGFRVYGIHLIGVYDICSTLKPSRPSIWVNLIPYSTRNVMEYTPKRSHGEMKPCITRQRPIILGFPTGWSGSGDRKRGISLNNIPPLRHNHWNKPDSNQLADIWFNNRQAIQICRERLSCFSRLPGFTMGDNWNLWWSNLMWWEILQMGEMKYFGHFSFKNLNCHTYKLLTVELLVTAVVSTHSDMYVTCVFPSPILFVCHKSEHILNQRKYVLHFITAILLHLNNKTVRDGWI